MFTQYTIPNTQYPKRAVRLAKKALAGFMAGLFLFTSAVCYADGIAESSALSASLRTGSSEFRDLYAVYDICRLIEKTAEPGSGLTFGDVLKRLDSVKTEFGNVRVRVSPGEVIIEVLGAGVAARYIDIDPATTNVITPYPEVLKLSTREVTRDKLHCQIIRIPKALPANFVGEASPAPAKPAAAQMDSGGPARDEGAAGSITAIFKKHNAAPSFTMKKGYSEWPAGMESCSVEVEPRTLAEARDFVSSPSYKGRCTYHLRRLGDEVINLAGSDADVARIIGDPDSDIYKILKMLGPEQVSIHLGWSAEKVLLGVVDDHDVAESGEAVLSRDALLERIVNNVKTLQESLERSGFTKRVLLETLDYHPGADYKGSWHGSAYEHVTDPEFVKEVLCRTGARLLIDCSHTLISAKNRAGLDADRYMDYVRDLVTPETIRLLDEVHIAVPERRQPKQYEDLYTPFSSQAPPAGEVREILKYIFDLREQEGATHDVLINLETGPEHAAEDMVLVAKELDARPAGRRLLNSTKPSAWRTAHNLNAAPKGFIAVARAVIIGMMQITKSRLTGDIPPYAISRTLVSYNGMIKNMFADLPVLRKGLSGVFDVYTERNGKSGKRVRYLDACGGMGCAATEAAAKYGEKGLDVFMADIVEWKAEDLPPAYARKVRDSGAKRGVSDILSRQFTFIRSDITDVKLPEKMDVMTNIAALQYTDNPLQVITHLYNNLDRGGILLTGYWVLAEDKPALEHFYVMLEALAGLGAEVSVKTSYLGLENAYLIGISIIRNDDREIRLNLIPAEVISINMADNNKGLSQKVVYYRADGSGQAISVVDKPARDEGAAADAEAAKIEKFVAEQVPHEADRAGVPPIEILAKEEKAVPDPAAAQINYIDRSEPLFRELLGEGKPDVLLRVPVQGLEDMSADNAADFLAAFQKAPNGYVELFDPSSAVAGEVGEDIYRGFGLEKKALPESLNSENRTRLNTVTLIPARKNETLEAVNIQLRLGDSGMTPGSTIPSPIGLKNDRAGLINAAIFGLNMMKIARSIKKPLSRLKAQNSGEYRDLMDRTQEVLELYKSVCDPNTPFEYAESEVEDVLGLAAGDVNCIVRAINKLLKFLPITPIGGDTIRRIFERAAEVVRAA